MRHIFLFVFTFLFFSLSAQEKIADKYIGWKGEWVSLQSMAGVEFSCAYVMNQDSLKTFVFDNSGKIIATFAVYRKGADEKCLGSFIKNDNIYLYTNNGSDAGIHVWVFNITNKSVKENTVPLKINKNKGMSYISTENHFCYLTINKSSADFVVYDFRDEQRYDTTHYSTGPDVEEKTRTNIIFYAPRFDYDIGSIHVPGETNINDASPQNKVYVHGDSLFFLTNKTKFITGIYTFDLANKKMIYREIMHKHDGKEDEYRVENSFLFGNKLYYVSATTDALSLQVNDFYSGNFLRDFRAKDNQEISFKSTPIILEGGTFGERELGKTKQLLRKMTNTCAVITVCLDSGGRFAQVMIGSYLKQYSPGMSAGGPTGVGGAPVFTGIYSSGSWVKSARFKMLIDPVTNEFINNEQPRSINDRVEVYNKEIKIPDNGETLFMSNDNYYYCYYDKKLRSFNVVRFKY